MRTQRAAAFRNATELLRSKRCVVVLLGPMDRTWYTDIGQIEEIVEYLASLGARILIAGKLPFDQWVEEAALLTGADLICTGPTALQDRLKLKGRSEWLLEDADLVVAFPSGDGPVTTADPIVDTALAIGTPVLAIYRNEEVSWVTAENFFYA